MAGLWKENLWMRLWAWKNVPLLASVAPRIVELNDERARVVIRLRRHTRNHLRSMYFGSLCIGADVTGGLIAFHLMQTRKLRFSFVFKDIRGEFLKRPEGDVLFTCEDGAAIRDLVSRTIETGERQNATVTVTATVPSIDPSAVVARFELTLSLKRR